ncbi:S8 family serine peptidase [Clavibacter zhangzhiyongii]|uniref:S8 family serine peptidase n=1 Tax=Clavibacter zhangzhiyongii TaxID=2768071 RepID=A0A7L7YYT6_9MICO|nr:S8 family serine peptidase [Clavibacter zhangzhiyongii]QOD42641.1 S8 family serine peptidase [Clavibacter zhangzhiyongii]
MSVHHQASSKRTRRGGSTIRAVAVGVVFATVVLSTGSTASAAEVDHVEAIPATDGHYIVTLRDEPAASYDGDVEGLAATRVAPGGRLDATSDDVQRYSSHLEDLHATTVSSVGASISEDYSLTTNGFSTSLTAAQVRRLRSSQDVLSVEPDAVMHPASTPSIRSLGLDGDDGVWAQTGGQDRAGEGTVIGVLDTGIAPHNPSFAGAPLGSKAGADPWRDGAGISFRKSDGGVFHGVCQEGEGFTSADCSTKVIGARYFIAGRDAAAEANGMQEPRSPLDTRGHGSHTASTAAGNANVEATVAGRVIDRISGVAPAAKIAAYKACWAGPDASSDADDGCAHSDIIAAIEQATKDGVDVINMSFQGDTDDAETRRALLGAASAGVFVAASAGNGGPDAGTVGNAEPWVTTVAASTVPDNYSSTLVLGDGHRLAGQSVTVVSPVSGYLSLAAMSGVSGAVQPELCGPMTLDRSKVSGRIVVCDRGTVNRVDKSAEVRRAGGIGMVLVNPTADSVDLDAHSVPTIHFDSGARQKITDYAAQMGATATLVPGNTTGTSEPAPQIANYSSRGPKQDEGGDVVKPDIAAPGSGIVAAVADVDGKPAFGAESGTSMSSPHIAGLGLLYLGEHPKASPAEVKSAMMTTAYDTLDNRGTVVTDPFAQGAGEVLPKRYLDPGLLYLSGPKEWAGYAAAVGLQLPRPAKAVPASQLNLPSIAVSKLLDTQTVMRTVTSTRAGTWKPSVQGLDGVDAKVTPKTLSFSAAGQTRTFSVRLTTRNGADTDTWSTGSLTWTDGTTTARIPVAVNPQAIDAPASATGTGSSGSSGSTSITVTGGVRGRVTPALAGLARGEHLTGTGQGPGTPTGRGARGESLMYPLTLASSLRTLVLDVAPVDGKTDMDLVLARRDDDGALEAVQIAESPSLTEWIIASDLSAGEYTIVVEPGGTAGTAAAFNVTQYRIDSDTHEGAFSASPTSIPVKQGRKATFRASWTGLEPDAKYVGVVSYAGSPQTTIVDVDTSSASASPHSKRAHPSITPTASEPPNEP